MLKQLMQEAMTSQSETLSTESFQIPCYIAEIQGLMSSEDGSISQKCLASIADIIKYLMRVEDGNLENKIIVLLDGIESQVKTASSYFSEKGYQHDGLDETRPMYDILANLQSELCAVFNQSELQQAILKDSNKEFGTLTTHQASVKCLLDYSKRSLNIIAKGKELANGFISKDTFTEVAILDVITHLRDAYETMDSSESPESICEQYQMLCDEYNKRISSKADDVCLPFETLCELFGKMSFTPIVTNDIATFKRSLEEIKDCLLKVTSDELDSESKDLDVAFNKSLHAVCQYLCAMRQHFLIVETIEELLIKTYTEASSVLSEYIKQFDTLTMESIALESLENESSVAELDLDELESQLPSDEELLSLENKLNDLSDLFPTIINQGMSKDMYAALAKVSPEALNANYSLESHTQQPSRVNKQITLEGIYDTVVKTIKIAIKKIIEFCKKIYDAIIDVYHKGSDSIRNRFFDAKQKELSRYKHDKGNVDDTFSVLEKRILPTSELPEELVAETKETLVELNDNLEFVTTDPLLLTYLFDNKFKNSVRSQTTVFKQVVKTGTGIAAMIEDSISTYQSNRRSFEGEVRQTTIDKLGKVLESHTDVIENNSAASADLAKFVNELEVDYTADPKVFDKVIVGLEKIEFDDLIMADQRDLSKQMVEFNKTMDKIEKNMKYIEDPGLATEIRKAFALLVKIARSNIHYVKLIESIKHSLEAAMDAALGIFKTIDDVESLQS